jgi:hypothetical protein
MEGFIMSEKFGSHSSDRPQEHSWGVCPNPNDPMTDAYPTFSWNELMRHLNRERINADNNGMFALLVCGETYPGKWGANQHVFEYNDVLAPLFLMQKESGEVAFAKFARDPSNTPRFVWELFKREWPDIPVQVTGYVFRKV